MAAKKTAAKKTAAKKPAGSCLYCGRDAVGELVAKGAAVCEVHKARAESKGQEVK